MEDGGDLFINDLLNLNSISTSSKDDTELFAGEKLGKVMVPHPALGFPTSISLTYKSYNGWLSRGLQLWNIYKVVVTDSYGQSYSLCKRFFSLESGVPFRFDLLPGNCHIPEEVYEVEELPPPVTLDRVDGDRTEYNRYEAIKQSTNYGLGGEEDGAQSSANLQWQNLIDGNVLERDSTETSRGFDTTDHIGVTEVFEPVLRKDQPKLNKGRNLEGFQEEVVEPILRSTTQRTRDQVKAATQQQTNQRKSREEQGFLSVQLFPFRLGELLERAERYARQTLLPLISETAPRLFGFGTVLTDESDPNGEENYRKGKEIVLSHEVDTTPKNIYESLRESPPNVDEKNSSSKVVQSRSIKEVKFYSNGNDLSDIERSDSSVTEGLGNERRGHQITLDDIRIDLPTYRPPGRMVKDFPYEFVKPEEGEDNSSSTTSTTTTSSTQIPEKTREEKVDRSWLQFDIPVFRALSRSFQDWTATVSKRSQKSLVEAKAEVIDENQKSQQQPVRRFIPLFGGFR